MGWTFFTFKKNIKLYSSHSVGVINVGMHFKVTQLHSYQLTDCVRAGEESVYSVAADYIAQKSKRSLLSE